MERRAFLALAAAPLLAGEPARLRGRLVHDEGGARLRLAGGREVKLVGDAPTQLVLADTRLAKEDFEAEGEFLAPDTFRLNPVHMRPALVWRDGKRLVVSYWCDVCAIRTAAPGKCMCCQEDTALSPRDPQATDADPAKGQA